MKKTQSVPFSLTENDEQMIQDMFDKGNFLSRSDVIRHCIRTTHKKQFPYYVEQGKKKDQTEAKLAELHSLPNEIYCTQVLGGEVANKICHIKHRDPENVSVLDIGLSSVKNFNSRADVWKSAGLMPDD